MLKNLKRLVLCFLLCCCILQLSSCKKSEKIKKDFCEEVSKLNSYKLTGSLESIYPTGTKSSKVMVYYQKPDMYRVELTMPNTIEKQVIVKNADGVYVIVPSIQKNFKVNTDWPLTSSYPYLLQSLSKDIIADEEAQITEEESKTTYQVKAHLFDDVTPTYQKIVIDNKTSLPTEVCIYKNDDNLISRFTIDQIEKNTDIDKTLFEVKETVQTLKSLYDEEEIEFDRAYSYPTYAPNGLVLKNETRTGDKNDLQVLLTYEGEGNVTIVQQYVNSYDKIKTEYIDGDIYILGGVALIYTDNVMKFYEEGIEYTLASLDVDLLDLSMMGESLRTEKEK